MPKQFYSARVRLYLILTIVYVLEMFNRTSLGVARPYLEGSWGITPAMYGLVGGAYFFGMLLVMVPAGILSDYLSPQKVIAGGVLCSFSGTLLFSISPAPPFLLLSRMLTGAGGQISFVAYMKILGSWYDQKRQGRMVGIASLLAYSSGILALAPLSFLMECASWRVTFLLLAGVLLLLAILIRKFCAATPEAAGFSALPGSDSAYQAEASAIKVIFKELGHILAQPKTWPPVVVVFCIFGTSSTLSGVWGTSYLSETYHIPTTDAASVLTPLMIGAAFSVILVPLISQQIGSRRWPQAICCGGTAVCWILLLISRESIPLPYLRIVLFAAGLFQGPATLSMLLIKELFPARYTGLSTTAYSLGANLGATVLPAIFGFLHNTASDRQNGFQSAFAICSVLLMAAFVCSLLTETHCRRMEDRTGKSLKE